MDQRRTNYRTTKLYHAKWNLIFESDNVSSYFLGIFGPYLDIEPCLCLTRSILFCVYSMQTVNFLVSWIWKQRRTSTFLAVP